MKESILKRWQKALTGGKYRKICDRLHEPGTGDRRGKSECCFLGVLCDLHRIESNLQWDDKPYTTETGVLPLQVMAWAGLDCSDPPIMEDSDGDTRCVTSLNDETHTSFKKFARILGDAQKKGLLGKIIKDLPRRKKNKPKTKTKKGPQKMSHRMLGSIMLTHLPSLRKAVMKDERLEWVEGATGYSYYCKSPDSRPCSHKIKVKDSGFEIGVVEDASGKGYRLEWESDANFGGIIGSKGEIIATAYAKEVSRDWAARNGFTVSESVDKEGSIVLTMTN